MLNFCHNATGYECCAIAADFGQQDCGFDPFQDKTNRLACVDDVHRCVHIQGERAAPRFQTVVIFHNQIARGLVLASIGSGNHAAA